MWTSLSLRRRRASCSRDRAVSRVIRTDHKPTKLQAHRLRDRLSFPKPSGGILVQQAGDQGLIREALLERPLLDRLQVLARDADVEATVLAKRCLGIPAVAAPVPLHPLHRAPFTALDRFENRLFLSVKFHSLQPSLPR